MLVGGAWGAQPTQADIDFCNQQAMARSTQGSPRSSDVGRQPGQLGTGAAKGSDQPAAQGSQSPGTGGVTAPGTVTSPGSSVSSGTGAGNAGGTTSGSRYPGHTGTGSSAESGGPTSGRSMPPGSGTSGSGATGSLQNVPGMSPMGESNMAYRQAYIDCLQQRVK
jgi:hypothetical protein